MGLEKFLIDDNERNIAFASSMNRCKVCEGINENRRNIWHNRVVPFTGICWRHDNGCPTAFQEACSGECPHYEQKRCNKGF